MPGKHQNRQARRSGEKSKISMIATLTYTLILAAIYFGIKAIGQIDHED